MFENCHSPEDAASVYRRVGFTVTCVGGRVALVATPALGGVAMPAHLVPRVRWWLTDVSTTTTTVVVGRALSGPATQVFLVGPAYKRRFSTEALDLLADAGVRHLDDGQRIWLPMSDSGTGWTWIGGNQPFLGIRLPSATSVLTPAHDLLLATRRATLP
ncbi:hypothetical protein ACFYT3_09835 [Nocardia amikacinitolerans]|uniref:hypothetical protein n=1 Tax=Nocardia amikacinitolerans TaxID=756689 RepID=UPI00369948CE